MSYKIFISLVYEQKLFFSVLVLFSFMNINAQSHEQPNATARSRENFDFNWQFHKGNIAMKLQVKAGCQGGITDTNAGLIAKKDTVIDYTNPDSYKKILPADWKEVNLPHDWVVEGT
ncbi:MAG: hypothetical protein Q8907_14180, partial [Bacteroidota bacterium]|nr:hypothetical protein [Bacteroidota bacterium]